MSEEVVVQGQVPGPQQVLHSDDAASKKVESTEERPCTSVATDAVSKEAKSSDASLGGAVEEQEEEDDANKAKLTPDGALLRPKQWLDNDFQPHQNDVLCGRGKTYREWPGNERFRLIVEAHLDEYRVAIGRSEKGVILSRIVEIVRNQEGATGFLKQGQSLLVPVLSCLDPFL